jgi:Fe-S-cluster containining protein
VKKKLPVFSVPACRGCPSKCCHDLSMLIGAPTTKADFEDLHWQLRYDTVRIYIRNRRWYVLVEGRCMYLTENNLCRIYETRPQKCRDHNPPDCERYGEFWDVMFETPEDLEAYLKKKKQAAKRRARARAKKKRMTA